MPYPEFVETAKRLGVTEVYCLPKDGSTLVNGLLPSSNHFLEAEFPLGLEETIGNLTPAGIGAYEGHWQESEDIIESWRTQLYIAAVAYKSDKKSPGVWVDAYLSEPTPAQVLKAIYDEFKETGELNEVSMEEFVRLASPNVIVVSPSNIQTYLESKENQKK